MIEISIAELFLLVWAIGATVLAAYQNTHKKHLVRFINAFLNNPELREEILRANNILNNRVS
jgi:hypothetical protein